LLARPRGGEDVELVNPDSDVEGDVGTSSAAGKGKGKVDGGEGSVAASLDDNKCYLVWLRDREFSSFKAKSCPTDREFLGERMKGYWDIA
jgi:U4/U6 small nuclear ribonucleoprotein PRP3